MDETDVAGNHVGQGELRDRRARRRDVLELAAGHVAHLDGNGAIHVVGVAHRQIGHGHGHGLTLVDRQAGAPHLRRVVGVGRRNRHRVAVKCRRVGGRIVNEVLVGHRVRDREGGVSGTVRRRRHRRTAHIGGRRVVRHVVNKGVRGRVVGPAAGVTGGNGPPVGRDAQGVALRAVLIGKRGIDLKLNRAVLVEVARRKRDRRVEIGDRRHRNVDGACRACGVPTATNRGSRRHLQLEIGAGIGGRRNLQVGKLILAQCIRPAAVGLLNPAVDLRIVRPRGQFRVIRYPGDGNRQGFVANRVRLLGRDVQRDRLVLGAGVGAHRQRRGVGRGPKSGLGGGGIGSSLGGGFLGGTLGGGGSGGGGGSSSSSLGGSLGGGVSGGLLGHLGRGFLGGGLDDAEIDTSIARCFESIVGRNDIRGIDFAFAFLLAGGGLEVGEILTVFLGESLLGEFLLGEFLIGGFLITGGGFEVGEFLLGELPLLDRGDFHYLLLLGQFLLAQFLLARFLLGEFLLARFLLGQFLLASFLLGQFFLAHILGLVFRFLLGFLGGLLGGGGLLLGLRFLDRLLYGFFVETIVVSVA